VIILHNFKYKKKKITVSQCIPTPASRYKARLRLFGSTFDGPKVFSISAKANYRKKRLKKNTEKQT